MARSWAREILDKSVSDYCGMLREVFFETYNQAIYWLRIRRGCAQRTKSSSSEPLGISQKAIDMSI
jgi:hypothetical protein